MSEDAHYRFPPAAAYRLNRCLFALKSDAAFRQSFQQDAARAMTEAGLGDHEQKLMLARDRDALIAAGAHPYLVFKAELRLRDRKSTRLNSSHDQISYAVFCLKKKNTHSRSRAGHQCTRRHRNRLPAGSSVLSRGRMPWLSPSRAGPGPVRP